jgi:hypothetical protein
MTDTVYLTLSISFMALVCARHLEYRVALQYQKLSPEIIRNELIHVQLTFLKHNKSNKQYCVPSKVGQDAKGKILHSIIEENEQFSVYAPLLQFHTPLQTCNPSVYNIH